MRKTRVKTMAGQLLFAEVEADVLILDCLLGKADSDTMISVPVTLKARVPKRARRDVVDVVTTWTEDDSEVAVTISDTARGTEVEIVSACQRIVLQP